MQIIFMDLIELRKDNRVVLFLVNICPRFLVKGLSIIIKTHSITQDKNCSNIKFIPLGTNISFVYSQDLDKLGGILLK